MTKITRYEVQTKQAGQWSDEVGEPNIFGSEAEAEQAIAELKTLGEDWQAAEYQVVEIQNPSPGKKENLKKCESCEATDPHTSATAVRYPINSDYRGYEMCEECATEYDGAVLDIPSEEVQA